MPHARIRGYDLRAALALPGVRAIVTGDDLGERIAWAPSSRTSRRSPRARCATSARSSPRSPPTPRRSRAPATRLIRVDYEELPAVLDPAGRAGAGRRRSSTKASVDYVKVFDAGTDGNLCSRTDFTSGDVDAAWARVRRRRRGRATQTQAASACLARAVRRAGRDRCRRPHHAVVGEPVGVPRPGQRLRVARPADDAGCAA